MMCVDFTGFREILCITRLLYVTVSSLDTAEALPSTSWVSPWVMPRRITGVNKLCVALYLVNIPERAVTENSTTGAPRLLLDSEGEEQITV